MEQVKFNYTVDHIVFFVTFKGTPVEVLRAKRTGDLQRIKQLRGLALDNAREVLGLLKMAS